MHVDDFRSAGVKRVKIGFTDAELEEQIEVLERVVTYFEARGDSGIILAQLHLELGQFNSFKRSRLDGARLDALGKNPSGTEFPTG